jgi:hypothetical protein
MATVSLCMANPAIAAGILGYRFAYGVIHSFIKSAPNEALITSPSN